MSFNLKKLNFMVKPTAKVLKCDKRCVLSQNVVCLKVKD